MDEYAVGRVITGFSKPYVANYTNTGGTNTYTNGKVLARGVSVSIAPNDAGDDNVFYADNVAAETQSGRFTGGELTLTVDGLFLDAERMINGLPAAGDNGWTADGDSSESPYLTVAFIVRYMSNGATIYTPYVIPKTKFAKPEMSAETQDGDEIKWQTQELTAQIMRDDTNAHNWRYIGADVATEAAAEAAIRTFLGISA